MNDPSLLEGFIACSERVDTLFASASHEEVRLPWRAQAQEVLRALGQLRKTLGRNIRILKAKGESPELANQLWIASTRAQALSDLWVQLRYPAEQPDTWDGPVRNLAAELVPSGHSIHRRLCSSVHQLGGYLLWTLSREEDRAAPILINTSHFHRADVLSQALSVHEIVHGIYPDLEGLVEPAVSAAVDQVLSDVRTKVLGRVKGSAAGLLRLIENVTHLWAEWRDEVSADVGATFLAGPAYALAFAREFAHDPLDRIYPEHPPRRVRWVAIQAVLKLEGFAPVLPDLFRTLPPPDFSERLVDPVEHGYLTHPDVVGTCLRTTLEGLERLGCRAYDRATWEKGLAEDPAELRAVDILNRAAKLHYEGKVDRDWSQDALDTLRRMAPAS